MTLWQCRYDSGGVHAVPAVHCSSNHFKYPSLPLIGDQWTFGNSSSTIVLQLWTLEEVKQKSLELSKPIKEFSFFSFLNGARSDFQTLNCQKTVQTRNNQQEKKGPGVFVVAPSVINHLWDKQEVVPRYGIAKVLSSPSNCVERLEHRLPDVWRPALPFVGNWEEHQHLSCTARVPENNLKRIFNKYQDWLCRTAEHNLHYGLDWTEPNTAWFALG